MKIAIIGTGNVGSALATGWTRSGHRIVLGVRDITNPGVQSLRDKIQAAAMSPADAAEAGEVVVLALPWNVAEEAISALGPLNGKIVIDCMNPLAVRDGVVSLERGFSTSAGETVGKWLPQARVVKTLNQVGAEIMANASAVPSRPAMFMAGDDASAKATVGSLLRDLGFEPLDAGDLSQARILEPLGMVWINQALIRGKGRNWAFTIASASAPPRESVTRDSRASVAIIGLDHVQLAMPRGGEDRARAFYGDVLGLPEKSKPPELAARGGCWFETDSVKIHLGAEQDFRPSAKSHPGLLVGDLDRLLARCRERGFHATEPELIEATRRAFVRDPFENRIELIEPR